MGILITLRSRIFTPDWSQRASEQVLDIQLNALVDIDLLWLRLNPRTPNLRDSGVRYFHDGIVDEWHTIDAALHDGVADCKGLAAWRVAELRASGEDPAAHTFKKFAVVDDPTVGNMLLYHIQAQRGDGRIEDPSRDIGMNAVEPDGYIPVPGVAWRVLNVLEHTIGAAMLGDQAALDALAALRARADGSSPGSHMARYLLGVCRMIRERGYDPRKTDFVRRDDGAFEWDYPTGASAVGGSRGGR